MRAANRSVRLLGLVDVAIAALFVQGMVRSPHGYVVTADSVIDAAALALGVAGLGVLAGRTWGRVLAIVLGLGYLGMCAYGAVLRWRVAAPTSSDRFVLTAVLVMGLAQAFVVAGLLVAWGRPPDRAPPG